MAGQLISQRAYARRRGVSHTAVQKAVSLGRITTIDGKLDPDLADRQWQENTDLTRPKNSVTGTPKLTRQPDAPPDAMPLDEAAGLSVVPGATSSARGYAQARAARETYEARLAKVKFEQVTDKLVSADEIRVAAFNRARRTRDLMLAVPDRVAALVAAESDADECHRILIEEITRVCEELSRAQST